MSDHPIAQDTAPQTATPKPDKLAWIRKMLPDLSPGTLETIEGRQSNREAMSKKILGWTEASANATKKPGDSLAHAVSAHGPGTDQMPRLVTGRRADEVVAEQQDGNTPDDKVTLKTVPDGADVEMPAWDTVGNDPSNVSSRFGSATQMLLTVEEAFAQAALLQSRIAAEAKETDKEAMKVKEVRDAADALGKARTTEGKARLAAKLASEALQKAMDEAKSAETPAKAKAEEKVEALRKELEAKVATYAEANKAIGTAIDALRKAKQVAVPGSTRSAIGEGREKLVVEPGVEIGESFKVGDDEKALETGKPLTPEDMKRRYASVSNTKGIKTATVIMDPAYVEDEFGQKHKAGVQIQTAFPSGGEGVQRDVSPDDYKKIRAREDGTAALAPAKADVATAEQGKAKATTDREDQKEAIKALREAKDLLEARMDVLDPRNDPDQLAELYKTDPDIKDAVALDKAHKAIKLELAAAKAKIKDAEARELELAEEEKQAIKKVADKTGELAKQSKALDQNVAKLGAALDAKSYEAAETAANDAVASLVAIREQKAKADKALAEADSKLPKDQLAKLKRDASEAKSLEQSAIRQITEARQALFKGLEDAAAAAQLAKDAAAEGKAKAEQDLTRATSAVVAPGAEPKREDFTTGNDKRQQSDFQKALKAWTSAKERHTKALETQTARNEALEAAKAKLTAAELALTEAKSKAEALGNLMKVKL